jgi:hypothetical protein
MSEQFFYAKRPFTFGMSLSLYEAGKIYRCTSETPTPDDAAGQRHCLFAPTEEAAMMAGSDWKNYGPHV